MDCLGEQCYNNGRQEEVTRIHKPFGLKAGWGLITHHHILNQDAARTFRKCRTPVSIEDTTPSRQSQGKSDSSEYLRMDIVTGRGCLFKTDDNFESKSIVIEFTITNL